MAQLVEWEWAAITAADMELPMAWVDTVSKHSVLYSLWKYCQCLSWTVDRERAVGFVLGGGGGGLIETVNHLGFSAFCYCSKCLFTRIVLF